MNALTAPHPHPLVLTAAASVTVLALTGVAMAFGWISLPAGMRQDASAPPTSQQTVEAPVVEAAAGAAPMPAPTAEPSPPHASPPVPPTAAAKSVPAKPRPVQHAAKPPVAPVASRPAEIAVPPAPTSVAAVDAPQPAPAAPPAPAPCPDCGVIESITPIYVKPEPSGGGALIGAVVGGLVGNQFGGGSGKALATMAGVVGGAMAGNAIEANDTPHNLIGYEAVVRHDDGTTSRHRLGTGHGWRIGDNVEVRGSQLATPGSFPSNSASAARRLPY